VTSGMHSDVELGFELYELLPDAILAVDRRGVIRYANHYAGRLFGREPATLISATVETLLPEHLRERHIAHRAKYTAEPRMRPMGTGLDLVARRGDGTTFPIDIIAEPAHALGRTDGARGRARHVGSPSRRGGRTREPDDVRNVLRAIAGRDHCGGRNWQDRPRERTGGSLVWALARTHARPVD
jgi:PAS domain S-box-containing protein